MKQLNVRTIFTTLRYHATKYLGRVITINTISYQQQNFSYNKIITIQSESWYGF